MKKRHFFTDGELSTAIKLEGRGAAWVPLMALPLKKKNTFFSAFLSHSWNSQFVSMVKFYIFTNTK